MELQRNELLWILPVSSSCLQFSWIQFGVRVLRMGSSKRLPHDFEGDLPHRNSTEWDDTFLQATWIFHDYMGFWLFIHLEQKLFSSFAAWLWYHFSVHCVKLRIGNYIWCWGCSGFPDRCNSSAREQPSLVASLQDSAISRSHWSLSQLKANPRVKCVDSVTSAHPFLFFSSFFFNLNSCRLLMQIISALVHNGAGRLSTGKAFGFENAHGAGEAHGLQPSRASWRFQESMTNLISTFT